MNLRNRFKGLQALFKIPKAAGDSYNIYLYLQGITKETGNLNRLIRCTDYDHGFHMSGGISPKPEFTGMTIKKPVDRHSPPLALAALTNLTIPTMTLYFYCTRTSQVRHMLLMHNITIKSVKQHIGQSGKGFSETLVLIFTKIQWNFGTASAGWDLLKNQPT